jgi:hypothetical protein
MMNLLSDDRHPTVCYGFALGKKERTMDTRISQRIVIAFACFGLLIGAMSNQVRAQVVRTDIPV